MDMVEITKDNIKSRTLLKLIFVFVYNIVISLILEWPTNCNTNNNHSNNIINHLPVDNTEMKEIIVEDLMVTLIYKVMKMRIEIQWLKTKINNTKVLFQDFQTNNYNMQLRKFNIWIHKCKKFSSIKFSVNLTISEPEDSDLLLIKLKTNTTNQIDLIWLSLDNLFLTNALFSKLMLKYTK